MPSALRGPPYSSPGSSSDRTPWNGGVCRGAGSADAALHCPSPTPSPRTYPGSDRVFARPASPDRRGPRRRPVLRRRGWRVAARRGLARASPCVLSVPGRRIVTRRLRPARENRQRRLRPHRPPVVHRRGRSGGTASTADGASAHLRSDDTQMKRRVDAARARASPWGHTLTVFRSRPSDQRARSPRAASRDTVNSGRYGPAFVPWFPGRCRASQGARCSSSRWAWSSSAASPRPEW